MTRQTALFSATLLVGVIGLFGAPAWGQTPRVPADASPQEATADAVPNADSTPPARLEVQSPGVHEQTMSLAGGGELRYTISVPEGYSPQAPTPLIVALHYGGRVTPFYGRGMIDDVAGPALSELNAIIVAPDSLGGGWTTQANEAAVLQLLGSVIASYNIDRPKTILAGYSMGGVGAWHLGGKHQDRFAAVIVMAGNPVEADWKIPLYVMSSRDDGVIAIEPTEEYVNKLKADGKDVTFVALQGIGHFEIPRYAEPLEAAVPWVKEVWAR